MNTAIQYRSFTPDLEVRGGGDGRTIYGIAVPYNAPTRIDDTLVEQFARSAFNHQMRDPARVKFARDHMALGGTLIGAMKAMRDDPAGLYVELRASKTPIGDETLELVRDGALSQLSVAFRERQNRRLPGGITERVTADLSEVAVVLEGAYGDQAVAMGVRSAVGQRMDLEDAQLRAAAEQYLNGGLKDLRDYDTEARAILLGIQF